MKLGTISISIHPLTHPLTHPSIHSSKCIHPSTPNPSIHSSKSIHSPIHLSIYPPTHLNLSIRPPTHQSTYPSKSIHPSSKKYLGVYMCQACARPWDYKEKEVRPYPQGARSSVGERDTQLGYYEVVHTVIETCTGMTGGHHPSWNFSSHKWWMVESLSRLHLGQEQRIELGLGGWGKGPERSLTPPNPPPPQCSLVLAVEECFCDEFPLYRSREGRNRRCHHNYRAEC